MPRFLYSSLIRAPREAVWAFHERQDVLKLLRPPWQKMEVLERTGGLGKGARVVFRVWMGLVPVRWVAVHTACERPAFFVDEQISGPFRRWTHQHSFKEEGEATRLVDDVRFRLWGGAPVEWATGWMVRMQLRSLFRHRHAVTRRYCEKQQ
jgi:ligand-binding SRPBCC domain-containing protein